VIANERAFGPRQSHPLRWGPGGSCSVLTRARAGIESRPRPAGRSSVALGRLFWGCLVLLVARARVSGRGGRAGEDHRALTPPGNDRHTHRSLKQKAKHCGSPGRANLLACRARWERRSWSPATTHIDTCRLLPPRPSEWGAAPSAKLSGSHGTAGRHGQVTVVGRCVEESQVLASSLGVHWGLSVFSLKRLSARPSQYVVGRTDTAPNLIPCQKGHCCPSPRTPSRINTPCLSPAIPHRHLTIRPSVPHYPTTSHPSSCLTRGKAR
jgi:hypothetical protein